MRILQICQRPQRRGAEVFASELASELRRQGHEVAIVYLYPFSGGGRIPLADGDRVLGGDESHALETLIGFHPQLLQELGTFMESFRPDVTQVNGARTVKYGALARRLLRARTGCIVYRNIGAPDDWIRGFRRTLFYRAIFRSMDGVVAISRGSLEALRSVVPERTPLGVISNAVDPDALRPRVGRAELRASSGTPPGAPVAISLGSLSREKRVDRLIDAVEEVRVDGPDLHLWIVGEGPLRPDLEARVEASGLEEVVRFFGARSDVASYLAAADLLALTSDTEGIPAVLLEAGFMGLPVVATRVGGVPECVEDGETGLLVEPGDQEALVRALTRLATDLDLRERLGTNGRERVVREHSIDVIARQFLDFYSVVGVARQQGRALTPVRLELSTSGPFGAAESSFSTEMRFLTLVARPELGPENEARVVELLDGGLDWELLLTLAHRHKLFPLLARHLRGFEESMPPVVSRVLTQEEFANGCRILERTSQLVEVLSTLEERGIPAVPYKGPALAAQLYGSGALRPAGDLDLVVRPRDVPEARRALVGLGYSPQIPLEDSQRAAFMIRHRYHERFDREDGGWVELHWRFSNLDFPFHLDLDRVFSRLGTTRVGGHVVPTFRAEDLFLILSVHGAKHRWDRLEWIAGVAQLLRSSQGDIDWERTLERASRLGVRRTLLLALGLAHSVMQAPVPPEVLRSIRSDRQLPKLAGEVVDVLRTEPAGWDVPERFQRDRFRIRLRERWRDRLLFVWHRATTPSDPERWEVARVGGWLVPLHAFRRPVHVAGQLAIALRALIPWSA